MRYVVRVLGHRLDGENTVGDAMFDLRYAFELENPRPEELFFTFAQGVLDRYAVARFPVEDKE